MSLFIILSLITQFNAGFSSLPSIIFDKSVLLVTGEAKSLIAITASEYQIMLYADVSAEDENGAKAQADSLKDIVIKTVKQLGGKEKDIVVTNFNVLEPYEDDPLYRIEQDIQITMKKVKDINKIKEPFLLLEGVQVNSVTPLVTDTQDYSKAIISARKEAIKNARTQAQDLALEIGVSIGRPVYIAENVLYPEVGITADPRITVSITIYYEIVSEE